MSFGTLSTKVALAALVAALAASYGHAQRVARPLTAGSPVRDGTRNPTLVYFYLDVTQAAGQDVMFSVSALGGGDPNLYVSCNTYPTPSAFGWKADSVGPDSLIVSHSDGGYCANGYWMMGVGAGSNLGDNVTFVAFANVDPTRHPATLLPGVPMAGLAGPGETLQFEVTVPTGGPFTADVTPLQGDPDLYASCSWAPGPSQFTWQSSTTGIDSLTVQPSDARFCANGTFFVGVYGFRAASKFVLTASDDQLRPIELEPNVPVETTVEQDTYMFFETHLPDADSDLFIDVSPVTGNPDVFMNCFSDGFPTSSKHTWASTNPGLDNEHIAVLPSDAGYCAPGEAYVLAVQAESGSNSGFSILATSPQHVEPVILIPNAPQTGTLTTPDVQPVFKLEVTDMPNTTVVWFNGTVSGGGTMQVFVSSAGKIPTKQAHQWESAFTRGGDTSVRVSLGDAAFHGGPLLATVVGEGVGGDTAAFRLTAFVVPGEQQQQQEGAAAARALRG